MEGSVLYFDIRHALKVHDIIIRESGGFPGVKDKGAVESILEHIKNDVYYPYFEDKITHLIFSTIKHHAFNDGNKRSSLGFGAYFLEINGLGDYVRKFIYEMENIVVWVAENKIDKNLLKEIIISIIAEDDYSEELKLKIFHAIS